MKTRNKTTRRGEIGLADLAIALKTLPIGEDRHLQFLVRTLQFAGLHGTADLHRRGGFEPNLRGRRGTSKREPEKRPGSAMPAAAPKQPERPAFARQTEWSELPDVAPLTVDLPAYVHESPPDRSVQAVRSALFPRRTASGVLGAAAATACPGRDLDLPALIQRLVDRKPLEPLPRLPTTTLSRGVQLICDRNEAMTPFFLDQADLAKSLLTVVGETQLEVFDYLVDPRKASAWCSGRERAWRPRPGRPIIYASDLGLGASRDTQVPVRPAEWRALVRALGRKRCPVVFLVPLAPGDWPRWLDRSFNPLHWDPRTRAETVRGVIGRGHTVET